MASITRLSALGVPGELFGFERNDNALSAVALAACSIQTAQLTTAIQFSGLLNAITSITGSDLTTQIQLNALAVSTASVMSASLISIFVRRKAQYVIYSQHENLKAFKKSGNFIVFKKDR